MGAILPALVLNNVYIRRGDGSADRVRQAISECGKGKVDGTHNCIGGFADGET